MKRWLSPILISLVTVLPATTAIASTWENERVAGIASSANSKAVRSQIDTIKEHITANRFTEALALTKNVRDTTERSSLLTLISQWAWRSGKYELSHQIANQIQEPNHQAQALVEVALAYSRAKQRDRALNVLSQAYQLTRNPRSDLRYSAPWADYFAQIGAFDRALAITNPLKGYEKADATIRIARAYANAGEYARAIALAQQVKDGELQPFGDMPDLKVEALQQVVQQAIRSGQQDLALRAVNALSQGQQRVRALRTIAQHYRASNQPQRADAALNQAMAAARTVDKITIFYDRNTYFSVSNAGLLIDIARDYLMLRQPERAVAVLDEAIASARTLKDKNESSVREQVKYFSTIAKLYANLGQRDRALAAAESASLFANQFPGSELSSVFPVGKIPVLAEVAQIFHTAGATPQAMQQLISLRTLNNTVADPLQRIWGMEAIVKSYAAIGAEAQVKETVEAAFKMAQTLSPGQRDWVSDRLIVAAASTDPVYALQLMQSRLNRARQIPILAQIAVNYHATGQDPQAQAVVVNLQQVAATIADRNQRDELLNDVVRNYFVPQGARNLSISQLLQAGQINADIQSPSFKAYNWSRIAQANAFLRETSRAAQTMQFALESARNISDRFERRDLLWQLLEEALQIGEPHLARQIAAGFEEEPYRAIALQRVAFPPF